MVDIISARVMKGEGPCTKPNSICVSKAVADTLEIKVGDPVQVTGGKITVATVESVEKLRDLAVFLGRTVRPNADAHWDEEVKISKLSKTEPAKKIIVGPAEQDQMLEVDTDALKGILVGQYVHAGALIEIGRRTFRPIFTDTQRGQRATRLIAVETKPSEIVQVTEESELVVNREYQQADMLRRTSSVTYDDIGGVKDVIEKLREQVEIPIRNPRLFEKLGIEPPKGVLLHGPPGVGKTLIAKAVANESGAYFIGTGAAQLAASPGETERRLRELFGEAEQNQPSIIFMDEVDTMAPKREETLSPDERRIVGVLLELLDGMKTRGQVIVMAATNRPNALDQALRRPGRFDREIEIPIPNEEARFEILKIHSRYMPLEEDVDLGTLAENTHGYSGADLRHLCSEAASSWVRQHRTQFRPDGTIPEELLDKMQISMRDFLEGAKSITPSCGRDIIVEIPKVRWDQVGGYKELKQKIEELVLIPWRNRQQAKKYGVKVPRGILLYGDPGTGKTHLAKAIATEAKVKVIRVSGAKLKSKWFGEYEQNIARTFEIARKAAPVVVIIDEVESIASTRGGLGEGSKALDSGLNELLQQLDGVEEIHDVFLVCTTNRPDIVDQAFIRSGRVEYQFFMSRPDNEAREEILRVHLSDTKIPLGDDVSVDRLAKLTDGMVGADLWRVVRSASLKSFCEHVQIDNEKPALEMRHFLTSIDEVRAGLSLGRKEKIAPLPLQIE